MDGLNLFYDDSDNVEAGKSFNNANIKSERIVVCITRGAINIQMTMIRRKIKRKRKRQMMIIFLLISVDFNLLTKKKINGLLA